MKFRIAENQQIKTYGYHGTTNMEIKQEELLKGPWVLWLDDATTGAEAVASGQGYDTPGQVFQFKVNSKNHINKNMYCHDWDTNNKEWCPPEELKMKGYDSINFIEDGTMLILDKSILSIPHDPEFEKWEKERREEYIELRKL